MVSWEPSAKVVAEHLVTARIETVLSSYYSAVRLHLLPTGHPLNLHISLKTFILMRK